MSSDHELSSLAGRVVVVGSMMVDLIAYCDRFPDDGETLVGDSWQQGFGGKGANQAVTAAKLGGDVAFVGCVGDDQLGSDTISNLAGHGVDTAGISVVAGAASGVAPIWVDAAGRNRILIVPGANAALAPSHVEAALDGHVRADAVLAQLETGQEATKAAFTWARAAGARTILNPAPAAPVAPDLLELTDWLVPNEHEFAALWGSPPSVEAVSAATAAWRCGLVVTLGDRGARGVDPAGAAFEAGAWPLDVVDTTGAGDAFVGAFAMALASGFTAAEAARLGCACGSLSTTRLGTQTALPSLTELQELLATTTGTTGEDKT